MFDWSEELDDLRTHSLTWLENARDEAVREQRRWRIRELAITRVLDERGAVDDRLAARDGVSVREVHETLETARALESLPHLAAVAADGRLSDGQLRAATRLADERTDAEWAERAPRCSTADLQRLARAQRTPTAEESRRRWEARSLRTWWDPDGHLLHGRFTLPDLQGAKFESTVQQITERLQPAPGRPWDPWDRRAADALIALCARALGDRNTVAEGIEPKVVVTVPYDGPAEITGVGVIADELVEQLRANSSIEVAFVDGHGSVVSVGRATTVLPRKVKRAVIVRDGRCRWPGCEMRTGLEVHHLVPRSAGGSDDSTNLVTVCSAHHRRLVPHGTLALVGNPNVPDGLHLVGAEARPASGWPSARAGPVR